MQKLNLTPIWQPSHHSQKILPDLSSLPTANTGDISSLTEEVVDNKEINIGGQPKDKPVLTYCIAQES